MTTESPMPAHGPPGPRLTDREREIAALVAEGLSDKQIAATIGKSRATVRKSIERLAIIWSLDAARNLRVQIANRVRDAA